MRHEISTADASSGLADGFFICGRRDFAVSLCPAAGCRRTAAADSLTGPALLQAEEKGYAEGVTAGERRQWLHDRNVAAEAAAQQTQTAQQAHSARLAHQAPGPAADDPAVQAATASPLQPPVAIYFPAGPAEPVPAGQ